MKTGDPLIQFTVDKTPTVEEINSCREKLKSYNQEQTHGEYDQPGIEIILVLKTSKGQVIGGIIASTMFNVMYLEVLWVAEEFRKQGYGRELVLAAESIGYEKGCISSHTWTFEFQGPNFYPKIGYKLIGVYDGYPNDLKEYVFAKRLNDRQVGKDKKGTALKTFQNGFFITQDVTKEETEILHTGLRSYVDLYVGDEKNGIGIKLVIRDQTNKIIAGLHAWTTINNLLIEFVWVAAAYRGNGLGKILMEEAESIAKKNGCIASLVCPLSFQNPEFFHRFGYQTFGYSDGYPDQVREYYLIKKYTAS